MFQAFISLICPISFPVILNQRSRVPIIIEASIVLFCDDEIDEAILEVSSDVGQNSFQNRYNERVPFWR